MTPEQIRDLCVETIAIGIYEGQRITAAAASRPVAPPWLESDQQAMYRRMASDAAHFLAMSGLLPIDDEVQGQFDVRNGLGQIVRRYPGERRFLTSWTEIPA